MRILQLSLVFLMALFGYTLFADNEFEQWKTSFRPYAIEQGISEATLNLALRGLLPDQKVLHFDSNQPEFSRPIWEYLDSAVSEERVVRGRGLLIEHYQLLERISKYYHIQPQYLLAIWGIESSFGSFKGNYSTIRSLATLAYKGREERREYWLAELIGALRIVEQGDIPLAELTGSWAGALGHTQFMPQSFHQYAVDFDGDGRRDVVNSLADALASTAHYLTMFDWQMDAPWGMEVSLPSNFEWSKSDPNYWQPIAVWAKKSHLNGIDDQVLLGEESAFVLLPAGYRGPAFLALRNFKVLLKYNNAISYALAVGLLAERIVGGAELQASWPREDKVLSRTEKAELQELLSAAGYSTDGIDGVIGANTRAALRRWQSDVGYPADGYATLEHLLKLRTQVSLDTGKVRTIERL